MFSKFKLSNFITESRNVAVALSVAVMAESAFAAPGGGGNKAAEFLKAVIKWFGDLSPYVITLCVIVVGYMVLVRGNTLQESSKIIIGASIIGSASFIADMLT